ncbi:MAG TPA: hypothetical protein VFG87_01120 [Amycolatopsis sp.]|nr:hypothetical protein [Amycolatopsis sp.]
MRSPHDIPDQSMAGLVTRWSQARSRTFLAAHSDEVSPEDLFLELAYSARIAPEATSGRWCVVADLLRSGAVDNWAQIGTAMAMAQTAARDGFHAWITSQRDLRRRTSTIGITDAEAEELFALSEAVAW